MNTIKGEVKYDSEGLANGIVFKDTEVEQWDGKKGPLDVYIGNNKAYPELNESERFYGGCGEGREFSTLREACFASMYDELQTNESLSHNDGDVMLIEAKDETFKFLNKGGAWLVDVTDD